MLQQNQQIQNNLRQVRQSLNNVDTKINQLRQRISQDQRQLSNIAQQHQSHVNEIQQISQNFSQCYQQLDNTERMTQSLSQPQQFSTVGTPGGMTGQYTSGQYQGISGVSGYGQTAGGYNTSQAYGGYANKQNQAVGQSNFSTISGQYQPSQYSSQANLPVMSGQYTSYQGVGSGSPYGQVTSQYSGRVNNQIKRGLNQYQPSQNVNQTYGQPSLNY